MFASYIFYSRTVRLISAPLSQLNFLFTPVQGSKRDPPVFYPQTASFNWLAAVIKSFISINPPPSSPNLRTVGILIKHSPGDFCHRVTEHNFVWNVFKNKCAAYQLVFVALYYQFRSYSFVKFFLQSNVLHIKQHSIAV